MKNYDAGLIKWTHPDSPDVNELLTMHNGYIWMITGNRRLVIPAATLRHRLNQYIVEHEPRLMVSGMAIGADLVWARLALNFRIPLLACVPFQGQWKRWSVAQCEAWHEIMSHSLTTAVMVTDKPYAAYLYHRRNEFMCDVSDYLVAVHDGGGKGSGTRACMDYAVKTNHPPSGQRWMIDNK